jgi:hypothetical protein
MISNKLSDPLSTSHCFLSYVRSALSTLRPLFVPSSILTDPIAELSILENNLSRHLSWIIRILRINEISDLCIKRVLNSFVCLKKAIFVVDSSRIQFRVRLFSLSLQCTDSMHQLLHYWADHASNYCLVPTDVQSLLFLYQIISHLEALVLL